MTWPLRIYLGYAAAGLLCLLLAVASEEYWLAGVPLLVLVIGQAVLNFRPLFWLLLVCVPLGAEIALPGGFSTDLPTEPIAIGLTGLFVVHAARHWPEYDRGAFLHPIALLLYLHVGWILFTTLFGENSFVSIKFSLAKLWYIGAFFLLPLLLLRTPRAVLIFAHCVFWPLLFVAVQSLVRHAGYGFSFTDQFRTLHPFMRNHVAYAGALATFTPWFGYLIYRRRERLRSWRWLLYGVGPVWLLGIFFSYTRAAYVALALIVLAYFI
ncbi:MAG: O-antigen ligase family protein, partial [Lewinella sp.]